MIVTVSALETGIFIHSIQYLPLCGHALNTTPINPQIKSNPFTEDQAHDKPEVVLDLSKEKKRSEIMFTSKASIFPQLNVTIFIALKIPPKSISK